MNGDSEISLAERDASYILVLVSLGCLAMLIGALGVLGGLLSSLVFGCGVGCLFVGLIDLCRKADLKSLFSKVREDRSGLGWQLLAFAAGVVMFVLVWFFVGWPADIVYRAITSGYAFSGFAGQVVTVSYSFVMLLCGIGLFFLIIWLWVNVHRREEVGNY